MSFIHLHKKNKENKIGICLDPLSRERIRNTAWRQFGILIKK